MHTVAPRPPAARHAIGTEILMPAPDPSSKPTRPPMAEQRPHRLEAHGHVREDPWYWLRDDERADPDVLGYIEAENAWTRAVLAHTEDAQTALYEELVGRIRKDDASVPYRRGDWWYYNRYEANHEYPIYARRRGGPDGPTGDEQIILDVNALAREHTYFDLGALSVSPDGRWLAWVEDIVSRGEWRLRIRDLDSGETLAGTIDNVSTSLAWADDNRTLFYVRQQDETLIPWQVWRVRRDALPDSAELAWQEDDPQFYVGLGRSRDDRHIVAVSMQTITTEALLLDSDDPDGEFRVFLPRERGHEYWIEPVGEEAFIRTNWHAENFRLMHAELATAHDRDTWRELITHRHEVMLDDFAVFRDHLVLEERVDGMLKLRIIDRGAIGTDPGHYIESDEGAYTAEIGMNPQMDTTVLRYHYSSLATPDTVYDYDMATGERTLLKRDEVVGDFDPHDYATERLHVTARDGVEVPVTLYYRRRVGADGSAPLLVYGYGSYGISMDPQFSSNRLSLVDRGFVYAIAHVRGGEELGRHWYDGGRLLNKQNTFNDFVDVTTGLLDAGWGDPGKVVATGRSAGGLLMGAIANQRPDLYRVIVAGVPFVDVVTTMLDDSIPLTTFEYDEWGNPNEREYYEYILSYSPYDNVTAQAYPHIYVGTGLWDPAVQYWEPAKWVAKLRTMKTCDSRLVMYTDMDAGHRGQAGRFERLRETARELAFVFDVLGVEY